MAAWTSDERDKIGAAEELQLASLRRDGTLREPVTICVVHHGGCRCTQPTVSRHPRAPELAPV